MKHIALIILLVLSVLLVGCDKHAATTDNTVTIPSVEDQSPADQPSNDNMPPPPPPEPTIVPGEAGS